MATMDRIGDKPKRLVYLKLTNKQKSGVITVARSQTAAGDGRQET